MSSKTSSRASAVALDERQREAVEHVHGPIFVVAGAGTGKTTVLTRRIAQLVELGHARPEEILALTYTENAAREMQERAQKLLQGAAGLHVRTFHAYCNELLIRNGKQFAVLDDQDLWIFLRKRLPELRLEYFIRAANPGEFLHDLLDFIRRCHDELVGPEKYAEYVQDLDSLGRMPRVCRSREVDALAPDEALGRCREISSVFSTVERLLGERNFGTFGHMITRAHALLSTDSGLLEKERQSARFILVDEFQDANLAQIKILELLAGAERNVFAVGDPDQAIYQFRGASSAAFSLFQNHFPEARPVVLGNNRRSTTPILKCAFSLIEKNPEIQLRSSSSLLYKRQALISARDQEAAPAGPVLPRSPVESVICTSFELEASDIADAILARQKETRCKWERIGVLYRQHNHRDHVARELAERGIPFSIENLDVMDTPEVRDLLACLRAVVSEADGIALLRVAALPQFQVDPAKVRAGLAALPRDAGSGGLAAVLHGLEGGPQVLRVLQEVRKEIQNRQAKCREALQLLVRRFGMDAVSPPLLALLEFAARWENKPTTESKDIAEFLDYMDYFRDANGMVCLPPRGDDAVRLMTAHAAKGLEFDHVFVLRANSGTFPKNFHEALFEFPNDLRDEKSIEEADEKTLHKEEERRLFYVAMTRARDTLAIYSKPGRGKKDPTPDGYMRDLIKDPTLKSWLHIREAAGFQTDLFGSGEAPAPTLSRTSQWLNLPPLKALERRLSATAVETYQTCPLQFKLQREWRIPSEPAAALQYGAAMHRVLRTYYDAIREERPKSEEELLQLFREDLASTGIQDAYQYDLYLEQGVEQLRKFLDARRRLPQPVILHTEEMFEIKLGEVTIAGRIDRVDKLANGGVAITDYKTGKTKSQDDADESLQLSIYALAAREKWGYDVDHLVLYNLADNAPVITRRQEAELQAVKMMVEEVVADIAAGKFAPRAGRHCVFCAYRSLCPATEKVLPNPAERSLVTRKKT
jgi:DNA helicase-2/ATP-dependent DNA helicase PcrA